MATKKKKTTKVSSSLKDDSESEDLENEDQILDHFEKVEEFENGRIIFNIRPHKDNFFRSETFFKTRKTFPAPGLIFKTLIINSLKFKNFTFFFLGKTNTFGNN